MYRIVLKKQNGTEVATYRKDMRISDLFEDKNVMSVSIAMEKRIAAFYYNLQSYISTRLPTMNVGASAYRIADFGDIENMKRNPCVRRVEYLKMCDEYIIFIMIYSDEYGDDASLHLAVKA